MGRAISRNVRCGTSTGPAARFIRGQLVIVALLLQPSADGFLVAEFFAPRLRPLGVVDGADVDGATDFPASRSRVVCRLQPRSGRLRPPVRLSAYSP